MNSIKLEITAHISDKICFLLVIKKECFFFITAKVKKWMNISIKTLSKMIKTVSKHADIS